MANPPAVFSRLGHILHWKCSGFWCCIKTGRKISSKIEWRESYGLILKFALTVPVPWSDNLELNQLMHLHDKCRYFTCSRSSPRYD